MNRRRSLYFMLVGGQPAATEIWQIILSPPAKRAMAEIFLDPDFHRQIIE